MIPQLLLRYATKPVTWLIIVGLVVALWGWGWIKGLIGSAWIKEGEKKIESVLAETDAKNEAIRGLSQEIQRLKTKADASRIEAIKAREREKVWAQRAADLAQQVERIQRERAAQKPVESAQEAAREIERLLGR